VDHTGHRDSASGSVVLLFGSVLITNLRFLGRILTSEPAGPLAADLGRWTRAGLMSCRHGSAAVFRDAKKLFETPISQ